MQSKEFRPTQSQIACALLIVTNPALYANDADARHTAWQVLRAAPKGSIFTDRAMPPARYDSPYSGDAA